MLSEESLHIIEYISERHSEHFTLNIRCGENVDQFSCIVDVSPNFCWYLQDKTLQTRNKYQNNKE